MGATSQVGFRAVLLRAALSVRTAFVLGVVLLSGCQGSGFLHSRSDAIEAQDSGKAPPSANDDSAEKRAFLRRFGQA